MQASAWQRLHPLAGALPFPLRDVWFRCAPSARIAECTPSVSAQRSIALGSPTVTLPVAMVTRAGQGASRVFAGVLSTMSRAYGVRLRLDSKSGYPSESLEAAARQLLKVVHPDKGGRASDFQEVYKARATWRASQAASSASSPSAPRRGQRPPAPPPPSSDTCPAPHVRKRPAAANSPRPRRPPASSSPAPPSPPASSTDLRSRKRPAAADAPAAKRAGDGPMSTALSTQPMALCEHCDAEAPSDGYRVQGRGVLLTWNGEVLQDGRVWEEHA